MEKAHSTGVGKKRPFTAFITIQFVSSEKKKPGLKIQPTQSFSLMSNDYFIQAIIKQTYEKLK